MQKELRDGHYFDQRWGSSGLACQRFSWLGGNVQNVSLSIVLCRIQLLNFNPLFCIDTMGCVKIQIHLEVSQTLETNRDGKCKIPGEPLKNKRSLFDILRSALVHDKDGPPIMDAASQVERRQYHTYYYQSDSPCIPLAFLLLLIAHPRREESHCILATG